MERIILISAKAQNGKDTVAELAKEELELRGKKVLICHYADLLKYICKTFFNWNGVKDDTGRTILQHVGTDIIREQQLKHDYWVDFIIDMLWMFYDEWDYILIPDCRFPNEVERMKEEFNGSWNHYSTVQAIRVNRPNFDSGLTQEQLNHSSECALDGYEFDHYIDNNGTLDDLKLKVKDLLDNMNRNVL